MGTRTTTDIEAVNRLLVSYPDVEKVLSVRNLWAWLIMFAGKDVENRDWRTQFRGRFWLHMSQSCSRDDYFSACNLASKAVGREHRPIKLPTIKELDRGCIIGSIELFDCVDRTQSPWFMGKHGFLLREPQPIKPVQIKGRLGFYDLKSVIEL